MKKLILFLIMIEAVTVNAQRTIPRGFTADGTMFTHSKAYDKYVLIDPNNAGTDVKINKVTLKRSLYTKPQTDLYIEVYNVFFHAKNLAVFSVMPSLLHNTPQWKKIDIDTVKSYTDLKGIDTLLQKQFSRLSDQLTHSEKYMALNYRIIIKNSDGYYINTTDCLTEFFTVINKPDAAWSKYFEINAQAKMLSIAEYESSQIRKKGIVSGNAGVSYGSSIDTKTGPRLYLSYVDKQQNNYKFWLLDNWGHDTDNHQRGMDRFTYNPSVGIVAAAYEFFMPIIEEYYYSDGKDEPKIIPKTANVTFYKITPYFFNNDATLLRYLTEDVIKAEKIESLN